MLHNILTSLVGAACVASLVALLTPASLHGATPATPCASSEITAAIPSPDAKPARPDELTIVLAGDAGFGRSDAPVKADGVRKGSQFFSFEQATAGVAADIDGDLAFANLETVITDRDNLPPDDKEQGGSFHFRSHPAGVSHLIGLGFNLFSLTNNHAMDYGTQGVVETLNHMAEASTRSAIAYAGIGRNEAEAGRPGCLDLGGWKIGFAAIGIITRDLERHRAGPNRPGQLSYRKRPDFEAAVGRLASAEADYRILSIHYGLEGRVVPDKRQLEDWRDYAAGSKGIDLIVGHHPHVAQGVEISGSSLIFYGLGNFLHPGTADPTRFGPCRDYGLLAKVHVARGQDGILSVAAVQAIPLTKTQLSPQRFASVEDSHKRIYALNLLAAGLDNTASASRGVRFTPQADGSGLYCVPGAASGDGKIAALCRDWRPAPDAPSAVQSQLVEACRDKPFYGGKREPSIWNWF